MSDNLSGLHSVDTNAASALEIVDCKKHLRKSFVFAVSSYFAYHVSRTRTRNQRTGGYLQDHWKRMCAALDKSSVRLLYEARVKEQYTFLNESIVAHEFDEMWQLLDEHGHNCMKRLIFVEVARLVYVKRKCDCAT